MKVLLLSLFHPELVRGGAQQICYELFQGLQEQPDIEPFLLAAIDLTFPTFYKSGARITGFDGRQNEFLYLSRNYDYTWHKTSDELLVASFEEFLNLVQPDIVHFHHFLLFGVDLVSLTRRVLPKTKIVFTLHEFISICSADGHFVRTTDRSICSKATPVRCHQCFPDFGPEHFFLREQWMKRHLGEVDVFTTPSQFMIEFFVDWGLDRRRIVEVANAQTNYAAGTAPAAPVDRPRNRFGFFGQFVDNKGVYLLLEAVAILRSEGFTDFIIELNGDNLKYASEKRRTEIEAFLEEELALPAVERLVIMNGSYQVDQLRSRMSRIDWCIVPSVWYETFALVISEAWMFKRPVICSNVGAMAERVTDEQDGLLFDVGNARSLAETIRRACTEDGLWEKLVTGIAAPPPRHEMVDGYLRVYERLFDGRPVGQDRVFTMSHAT